MAKYDVATAISTAWPRAGGAGGRPAGRKRAEPVEALLIAGVALVVGYGAFRYYRAFLEARDYREIDAAWGAANRERAQAAYRKLSERGLRGEAEDHRRARPHADAAAAADVGAGASGRLRRGRRTSSARRSATSGRGLGCEVPAFAGTTGRPSLPCGHLPLGGERMDPAFAGDGGALSAFGISPSGGERMGSCFRRNDGVALSAFGISPSGGYKGARFLPAQE